MVFIGFIIFYFKFTFLKEAFNASFDANAMDGMTLLQQVRNTMIITLWTFIGIEAAVAMSGKVENQRQVSNAILTAFIICIIMYALVSMLPFGILTREQIAAYPNPSTAGILEYLAGKSGGILMNVGLVVSVLFSVLSLTTVTAEVPFSAAKDKTFPVKFTKENKNGVPVFSLFITALAIQLSFFIGFVSENAFHTLITITAVMVMPVYLATTLYLFKITSKKAFDTNLGIGRGRAYLTGIMGIMYTLWLIYAANIKYLVMAVIFFLAGVPVYLLARKEAKKN